MSLENSWAGATNVVVTLTGDEYFSMFDSVANYGDIGHGEVVDN